MVWVMAAPRSFGEFWPSGAFECLNKFEGSKWGKRLRLHYLDQTPNDQRRLYHREDIPSVEAAANYPFYAMAKFKNETGTTATFLDGPLTPIEQHEAPQSFDTEKGCKTLGSLIAMNSQLIAVDEALKAIIEQLEPGIHQFFPIEIRMPRGETYPANYYTLVVGQYFDAYLRTDATLASVYEALSAVVRSDASKVGSTDFTVLKTVFGNAHFWRDRRFKAEIICLSDELKAEIDKAGLRLPKHYKLKEV
jgi:hypothetical protein